VIYIIAGNYEQAKYHANEKGYSVGEWRYVFGPHEMMRLRDVKFITCGTWRHRKDVRDIEDNIHAFGWSEI